MADTKKRELDMDTLDLAVGGAQSNSQENKDGSQGVQQTNKNGTTQRKEPPPYRRKPIV